MPGAESPLVNEFKCDFIKHRLLETFLGGPKIRSCRRTMWSIHFSQFFLHLFPLSVVLMLITLIEVKLLSTVTAMYIVGGTMFVFTVSIQVLSRHLQLRGSIIAPVKPKLIQMSEEETLDSNTCCSSQCFQFVIPVKKYKINILIHAVVSGFLCAVAFSYLSPTTLSDLFAHSWTNYLLFIWGWVVVCIAQYSLTTTSPPEPVVFHPLDTFESASLMRPFCVFVFLAVHVISWYQSCWIQVDRPLHVVFAFLPLLWFMGIFPPLDALLPWLGEQIFIFILGGTAMASDLRLFLMLLLSCIFVAVVFFLPTYLLCLLVAAVSGFVFSLDLCNVVTTLFKFIRRRNHTKYISTSESSADNFNQLICGRHNLVILFYLFMFALGALLLMLSHFDVENLRKENFKSSFGFILLCLSSFNSVLTSVQQVYIIHGFFVNPIYPSDSNQANSFHRRMKPLNFLGYLRVVVIYVGAPLAMIAYLTIFISTHNFSHDKLFFSLCIIRAFRWIWQHTENALLEMTVIHYINHFYPDLLAPWGLAAELMLAAFVHNRLRQLWRKLHLVFIVLITSLSLSKQRQKFSGLLAVLNLLFLPVVLLIVGATCVVSAPLLPLFTLPIFLVGFPRPLKMWPGQIKKTSTITGDSVYYKQLTPTLVRGLQRCHLLGSLGRVECGDYFLIHFDDRLVFVLILEKGFGYCTFAVKGLELQETSCHAVEASHLNLLLTTAFENDRERHPPRRTICVNPEPFHVFFPLTSMFLVTYSDTRNVLTGLIDSPDILKLIGTSYVKTLVWVLIQHQAKKYLDGQKVIENKSEADSKTNRAEDIVQPLNARPRTAESLSKLPKAKRFESCLDELSPAKSTNGKTEEAKVVNQQNGTGWSDEDEEDPLGEENQAPVRVSKQASENSVGSRPGTTTVLYATHLPGTMGDDRDHELEFGLPAVDVNVSGGDGKSISATRRRTIIGNPVNYSKSAAKLAPKFEWTELPIDKKEISAFWDQYPIKWHNFVLRQTGKQLKMDEKSQIELVSDEALLKTYREIILTCHVVINLLMAKSDSQSYLRPSHVYKTFNGEIPWSPFQDWILNNTELFNLAIKAYGYATKLALDQILMGENGTDDEILEYLMEYDTTWHIGSDANNSWDENILQEKPNLFSLGFNPIQGTFTSHLLTLQELPIRVGRLNPEVVRGIWASLAFELFYLTNDDEERYSIQAHPIILRNLIVQAADPPLGYPIFISEPISRGLESIWKSKTS